MVGLIYLHDKNNMTKQLGRQFILTVSLIAFSAAALSAEYYVSNTGDDSFTASQAQSLNTPWKTIAKAASSLIAGDTVYIRGGTYQEQVNVLSSGSLGRFINFSGYANEMAEIRGTGVLPAGGSAGNWYGVINVQNQSFIQFSNLNVTQSEGFGFFLSNTNSVNILNNKISDISYASVYSENSSKITVSGNDIKRVSQTGNQQEALSMASTNGFTVSNNKIQGGLNEGIDIKAGSSNGAVYGNDVSGIKRIGIYVDAWQQNSSNIDVYNNIVRDPDMTVSTSGQDGVRLGVEFGGSLSNVNVFNNVVYGSKANGINIASYHADGTTAPVYDNISIYNNTVFGNSVSADWAGGISIEEGITITNLSIKNNIVRANSSGVGDFEIQVGTGLSATLSNNLTSSDPLFVDAAAHNFNLQADSSAINGGTMISGLTTDFAGNPRTGNPDIGAYEYVAMTTAVPEPSAFALMVAGIGLLGWRVRRQQNHAV